MDTVLRQALDPLINELLAQFHAGRIRKLGGIDLLTLLKRKNPYLYKAKDINTGDELVRAILDAYLSSQEETLFGDMMEKVAIFIASHVCGGRKSSTEGIDLEMERDGVRYLVSIKSGPNWGNSSQIRQMISNFEHARRTLRTSGGNDRVDFVNGCCYGKSTSRNEYRHRGDYFKYCGQKFWAFISGDENLYLDLIEPLGKEAKSQNEDFKKQYDQVVNRLVRDVLNEFCLDNGCLNWAKIVAFNSGNL